MLLNVSWCKNLCVLWSDAKLTCKKQSLMLYVPTGRNTAIFIVCAQGDGTNLERKMFSYCLFEQEENKFL